MKLSRITVLAAAAALFLLSPTASAVLCPAGTYDPFECCHVCSVPFDMVWPVKSTQLADEPEDSLCEADFGFGTGGHYGVDLHAEDGEPVYAAFDGVVYWFNETYHLGSDPYYDPNYYSLGCAVELVSGDIYVSGYETLDLMGETLDVPVYGIDENGDYTAYYGHLMDRVPDGSFVRRGNVIGIAGGAQIDEYCRGSSPSSRLYFELRDSSYRYLDPYTCSANTCSFWYTVDGGGYSTESCTPDPADDRCMTTRSAEGEYRYPSYACGCWYPNDPVCSDQRFYADVQVDRFGNINLECDGTGSDRECLSEVYGLNDEYMPEPLIASFGDKSRLNCFLRLIRVWNDGEYTCGRIVGDSVSWDADPDCSNVVSIGVKDLSESSNAAYLRLQPLTSGTEEDYSDYLVVSSEYTVIGVNDRDLVDRLAADPDLNTFGIRYHTDYILVRSCDLQGKLRITTNCKDDVFINPDGETDYRESVWEEGFTECVYQLVDAGKYYDYPDLYTEGFQYSRMGARMGRFEYEIFDSEPEFKETTLDNTLWWNNRSVERIWGCDTCEPGDTSCTLGSARHALTGECGYLDKKADYYGYLDLEDMRAAENPLYEWGDGVYDGKLDYESGIPDSAIVQDSMESITTNVNAYFVKETEWRGEGYWMHIDVLGPGGDREVKSDVLDWKRYLMPCAAESDYWEGWTCCREFDWNPCSGCNPCGGCSEPGCQLHDGACEKNVGGAWTSCSGCSPDCTTCSRTDCELHNSQCQWKDVVDRDISACESLPSGTDWGNWDLTCYTWFPVDDNGDPIGSQGYCGYGGVRVVDDEYKSETFRYSDYVRTDPGGLDCNDDVGPATHGNMPAVLGDQENSRDRYWKPNATDTEFACTRTGYCSGEEVDSDCDETAGRDARDRPASREHDPCRECDSALCPDECFNYDLSYYRQFNVDSLWANVFKVTPEVNYLITEDESLADANLQCAPHLPGKRKCSLLNVNEGDCDGDEDCIPGLYCTDAPWSTTEYCCPEDSYYYDGCCRDNSSAYCVAYTLTCPAEKLVLDDGGEPEYLMGLGEQGCRRDSDCASYYTVDGEIEQHCSRLGLSFSLVDGLEASKEYRPGHCCPSNLGGENYEYDITYECCLPEDQAVASVEMYDDVEIGTTSLLTRPGDVGYCEQKKDETGKKCGHGEGPCRPETYFIGIPFVDDCEGDLICMQSTKSTNEMDTACCSEDESWNGQECVPLEDTHPWAASWTRSGGDGTGGPVISQEGGGPIRIYAAGGATIPNGTEAAGWNVSCDGDSRWDTWPSSPDQCVYDRSEQSYRCYYCDASMSYRCPPDPIWFEARNFGNDYEKEWDSPLEYVRTCNGPYGSNLDGIIRPYHNWGSQLECVDGDCNCGRDMAGVGDRADANCPGNLQQTSCVRSDVPGPVHKCNRVTTGYGSFPSPAAHLTDDAVVDPNVGVLPESCGTIQRKEVVNRVVEKARAGESADSSDWYYPRYSYQTPESWFNYTVTEYDEDLDVLRAEVVNSRRSRDNVLEEPAAPHTILRDDFVDYTVGDDARYMGIETNYTVHNEISRLPYVKQCIWMGCSRLEEAVVSYDRTVCISGSGCSTTTYTSGSPPSCCGRWCSCGDGCSYSDDCSCQYYCWGCWHAAGARARYKYPVTMPDDSGEEKLVFEQINDTSTVKSNPYGFEGDEPYLRVENPVTSSNAGVKVDVHPKIVYESPKPDEPSTITGYLTVRAVDEETESIDLMSGFTLDVYDYERDIVNSNRPPLVTTLEFENRYYGAIHELTALESTLPRDYITIDQSHSDILGLDDTCFKYNPLLIGFIEYEADDPAYLRWLRNPAKKYYHYHDNFMADYSRYSWIDPLQMFDRADPACINYYQDKSAGLKLYRNYHEDAPRYYDYASIYWMPQDTEEGLQKLNYNPLFLTNILQTWSLKPIEEAYVRYAPRCDSPYYDGVTLTCSGSDTINCPDMCSPAAEVYCNNGVCDCSFKTYYSGRYPVSEEQCRKVEGVELSEPARCEGLPSPYKSFCADGKAYVYWFPDQESQFTYQWVEGYWDPDPYTGQWIPEHCEINYRRVCRPRQLPPQSYTLIFNAPGFTADEMSNAELEIRTNLRKFRIKPFA